jgi:glucan biosynthesis protein
MKGPWSFSAMILSWKSGTGEFSGSFLSIQAFQAASFLVSESGNSLKKASESFPVEPKECLERARIFNQTWSYMVENGLALSVLRSRAAPAFKKREISFPLSFPAV